MRRIARPLFLGLAIGVALLATACSKKEEEAAKPVAAIASKEAEMKPVTVNVAVEAANDSEIREAA